VDWETLRTYKNPVTNSPFNNTEVMFLRPQGQGPDTPVMFLPSTALFWIWIYGIDISVGRARLLRSLLPTIVKLLETFTEVRSRSKTPTLLLKIAVPTFKSPLMPMYQHPVILRTSMFKVAESSPRKNSTDSDVFAPENSRYSTCKAWFSVNVRMPGTSLRMKELPVKLLSDWKFTK
jgi:hypothetical protein